jgi:hypothetical protein
MKTNGMRAAAFCIAAVLVDSNIAGAQALSPAPSRHTLSNPAQPTRSSIDTKGAARIRDWYWDDSERSNHPNPQLKGHIPAAQPRAHSRAYRGVQRVLAGAVLGLVGFYVGGVTAWGLAENCQCGGTSTVWVGAGIGAAAGATAGALLVR